jgi:ABC-2 type transport system ATP-binding protein
MHQGRIGVIGKPAELKAALGPDATLDDVFAHYSGGSIHDGGNYGDIQRTRHVASRLG